MAAFSRQLFQNIGIYIFGVWKGDSPSRVGGGSSKGAVVPPSEQENLLHFTPISAVKTERSEFP